MNYPYITKHNAPLPFLPQLSLLSRFPTVTTDSITENV